MCCSVWGSLLPTTEVRSGCTVPCTPRTWTVSSLAGGRRRDSQPCEATGRRDLRSLQLVLPLAHASPSPWPASSRGRPALLGAALSLGASPLPSPWSREPRSVLVAPPRVLAPGQLRGWLLCAMDTVADARGPRGSGFARGPHTSQVAVLVCFVCSWVASGVERKSARYSILAERRGAACFHGLKC